MRIFDMNRLFGMLCVVFAVAAFAAGPDVVANGLFYGKALLTVDNEQVLLKVGESKKGVTLLEADGEHAVVEINGKRRVLHLGHSMPREHSNTAEFRSNFDARSHVVKAQLTQQTLNLATFEVEYYLDERELGELVTLSVKTLYRKKDTGFWTHSYARLKPGRHTVTVSISMNEKAPDRYISDDIQFDLGYSKNGKSQNTGALVFEFIKEWQRRPPE